MWCSSVVHGAERVGHNTPYTVLSGIDTVAVPNFNVDLLGNSYSAEADALPKDLYNLMSHNQAPPRQRMERVSDNGQDF